jgi:hypothetical protein
MVISGITARFDSKHHRTCPDQRNVQRAACSPPPIITLSRFSLSTINSTLLFMSSVTFRARSPYLVSGYTAYAGGMEGDWGVRGAEVGSGGSSRTLLLRFGNGAVEAILMENKRRRDDNEY